MKPILSLFLFMVVIAPTYANKKPEQTCKVKFAFVYVDYLNNTNRGIHKPKSLKEVQNKLSKYGDVCYTDDESGADLVFFVHTKPAVYHGVHTYSNTHTDSSPVNGTITDQNGDTSTVSGTINTTTTTTTSEPYEVDYSVFFLDIMAPYMKEGSTEQSYKILRTFDQKGLYNTIYGHRIRQRQTSLAQPH